MKAWIAKDIDGEIYLYTNTKPQKRSVLWFNGGDVLRANFELPKDINPKWEDEEPIEVEFEIKKHESENSKKNL